MTATTERSAIESVPTQLFIGGEWRDASGGATLDVEDPSTGETIASVADATPEDAIVFYFSGHGGYCRPPATASPVAPMVPAAAPAVSLVPGVAAALPVPEPPTEPDAPMALVPLFMQGWVVAVPPGEAAAAAPAGDAVELELEPAGDAP